MKGMVHLGVLRALDKLGIEIDEIIGTSIGAVIGSLVASGMSVEDLYELTQDLSRKDFFRLNVLKFLVKGYRHASLYKGELFRKFLEDNIPCKHFSELKKPFFCNALSLVTGSSIYFGLPGLDQIELYKAVYASASLPGIFEPLEHDGDHLVDGGISDSMPLRFARSRKPDVIIAVDLSVRDYRDRSEFRKSLPWILYRSFEVAQEALNEQNLHAYGGPDVVLIKPPVGHLGLFQFDDLDELVRLGEQKALEILTSHPRTRGLCNEEIVKKMEMLGRSRRPYVDVRVDESICINCGVCEVTCATDGFVASENGPVLLKAHNYECPEDGACMRNCPTGAITLDFP